jgi:cystathionine beta-synthase
VQYIVADAEKRGLLKAGGTIVENTSGNTGAAVAMIAAARGFKVLSAWCVLIELLTECLQQAILTMPDKVSMEKQNALRAYGAEVVVCPTSAPPGSPEHYEERCHAIAASIPGSFKGK